MFYSCLIVDYTGSKIWTAPREADNGAIAANYVRMQITAGNTIRVKEEKPITRSDDDGLDAALNWRYILAVTAYPVFS